ncbi:MAG: SRPBCC family protein [Pirellulaceae bacterium]
MPKYHVSKSIEINAAPDRVFETIVDYGTWTSWSPWLLADPQAKVTVSEEPAKVGSTYAWIGTCTGQGTGAQRAD